MRRISSATLELPARGYSCYIVFPFLVYEETYTCLSIVGLRVVQQVATLESCETFLFSSDFSEPYHVRPISCCFLSVHLPVLARVHLLVMFLHCMLQSSVALPLYVWWFFLTQRFLAPPVCSLGGPEPPPRSQTSMLLGTGGLGLFVLCMLVFMAYPSTLANASWKEVPKLEYQA